MPIPKLVAWQIFIKKGHLLHLGIEHEKKYTAIFFVQISFQFFSARSIKIPLDISGGQNKTTILTRVLEKSIKL